MTAWLRDERDLVWLVIDDIEPVGDDMRYSVHFLARVEPDAPPVPFASAGPFREPKEGWDWLLQEIGHAVSGEVTALRHDPIADGLSVELKRDGPDDGWAVVLWLDMTRMGRAMKARATRGRQQVGLRMFVRRAALEEFRAGLSGAEPAVRH